MFGFANVILPLQIGAPDVAFPRLNALSYWLFLFGALVTISGFVTPRGAADFGWFAYTPLSRMEYSPDPGAHRCVVRPARGPAIGRSRVRPGERRGAPVAAPVLVLQPSEVHSVALPFFGIVSEILLVFSRKPLFGYKCPAFATVGITALSMTAWAHHMFATGAVLLPFFAFLSLCCSPSGSW